MNMHALGWTVACVVSLCALGCAGTVVVHAQPPPERAEVATAAPSPQHFWVPGHWHWDGRAYQWMPGHWEARRVSHVWVRGHWRRVGGGWTWVEGRWTSR